MIINIQLTLSYYIIVIIRILVRISIFSSTTLFTLRCTL